MKYTPICTIIILEYAMSKVIKIKVATGIYWIEIPEINLYVLCGCPADSVKHLMKIGLIKSVEKEGVTYETGPNVILLSDILIQNGTFSNLSEFPILQMLYRQGMIIPNHPNNCSIKPKIIGSETQVYAQMNYIYRGNYGLISEEEYIDAGVDENTAKDYMRLKLKFAYGKIKKTDELLDHDVIGTEPLEIRPNVFVKRKSINVFKFTYNNESVEVDLNLKPSEVYTPSYKLGYHRLKKDYFSVIHSGNGNGWDTNRPTMGSVIMFQGKTYVVDAGPNISYTLNALGIGINEVEGIFQTHSHDDHFNGLTLFIHANRKIKFYSTPLVRASLTKKFAALLSISEEQFGCFFEICDLKQNIWNDIGGLEVKPLFSPHPVETTIMIFRAETESGYKTYGHFADIIDTEILKKMITEDNKIPGISNKMYQDVVQDYLIPLDLKKIDIGGGLIHGNAADFKNDSSKKIILSHIDRELTTEQREIGSGASNGMVDTLIPTFGEYMRRTAYSYLKTYFPEATEASLNVLNNSPIIEINPETIIVKSGTKSRSVYLLLAGNVELINIELKVTRIISAGAFIGEFSGLENTVIKETYRAVSYVALLQIPISLYQNFVNKYNYLEDILSVKEKRQFLNKTWLLKDVNSYIVQRQLFESMTEVRYEKDCKPHFDNGVYIVKSGTIELKLDNHVIDTLTDGGFWGESLILYQTKSIFDVNVIESSNVFYIDAEVIRKIPVILWKLLETYQKRMQTIFSPDLVNIPAFQWRDEYKNNIELLDQQHEQLFNILKDLYIKIKEKAEYTELKESLEYLVTYTAKHFHDEEEIMLKHNFPGYNLHHKKHEGLIHEISEFQSQFVSSKKQLSTHFISFLKRWVIDHILTEDRKYGPFLNDKGVY